MSDLATMRSICEDWAATEGEGYYPVADRSAEGQPYYVNNVFQKHGIKWTWDENGISDPWGSPYRYSSIGTPISTDQHFIIQSPGPDKRFDTGDDIWCSDLRPPTQGGTIEPPVNQWNFDQAVGLDIGFYKRLGIGTVYLQLPTPLDGEKLVKLRKFLKDASAARIEVYALSGDPSWALSERRHEVFSFIKKVLDLNSKMPAKP